MIKQIPNALTLLNLVSGFAATIYAIKGYNEYAAFCIIFGGILDFSDGFVARLLKAYSDLGKELDSLADIVTFGVAPGAIIFNLLRSGGLDSVPSFIIASLIPAASALRLAKFNTDDTQTTSFRGLATPASAFTIVSLVLASAYTDIQLYDTMVGSPWFIGILSLSLAVMMLVNTRMFSLKFTSPGWKGNEERWIFVGTAIILFLILKLASLPLIMASYVIISVVSNMIRRRESPAEEV